MQAILNDEIRENQEKKACTNSAKKTKKQTTFRDFLNAFFISNGKFLRNKARNRKINAKRTKRNPKKVHRHDQIKYAKHFFADFLGNVTIKKDCQYAKNNRTGGYDKTIDEKKFDFFVHENHLDKII